jgi:hypothetical protein
MCLVAGQAGDDRPLDALDLEAQVGELRDEIGPADRPRWAKSAFWMIVRWTSVAQRVEASSELGRSIRRRML